MRTTRFLGDAPSVPKATEAAATAVVDAALRVHRRLGPGLYENIYEACLAHELARRGFRVRRQVLFPVTYDGEVLADAFRVDLVVDDTLIVEAKATEVLLAVHQAQILSYLRLSGIHLGFLINFHSARLRDGIRRFVM